MLETRNSKNRRKVICFGEALIDLLSEKSASDAHETFVKYAGGAPANVAVALAKLGGSAYFSGMLGDDMFGHFLNDTLQQENVNTDYVAFTREAKTALAFVSLDEHGERSFEFYRPPAADLLFKAEDFNDSWFDSPGIFHICSNSLTDQNILKATHAGVALAEKYDWIVSFDVNLRLNLWPKNVDPRKAITALLTRSTIVKFALEELEFIANGTSNTEFIAALLHAGTKIVLLTNGGKALRWYTAAHEGVIEPANINMVDATAAGDAFMGGVLCRISQLGYQNDEFNRWLTSPTAIHSSLVFASHCGAYAAAHKGAFPALPTKTSLHQFFGVDFESTDPL